MLVSTGALRILNFLLFCLGKAGVVRGGFWLLMLLAPAMGLVAHAQSGNLRQVSAGRATPAGTTPFEARLAMHREEAWLIIASHLPDPAKANAGDLETAGDVLRARRFPEDALDFYGDAVRRGGDEARLYNKLGVTELGLRHPERARAYLKFVVKRDKLNADAWNNLGATEYVDHRLGAAIADYRKALKLSPGTAVFHMNLATALIEQKNFEDARLEFARAVDLDPEIANGHDNAAGVSAHVLSPEDRARYCFEMARVYATRGKTDAMLHSLAMAAESGMNVPEKMTGDAVLGAYAKDPRVLLFVQNAKAMRKPVMAGVTGPLAPLPASANASTD